MIIGGTQAPAALKHATVVTFSPLLMLVKETTPRFPFALTIWGGEAIFESETWLFHVINLMVLTQEIMFSWYSH
jgi:hypothetical protein